VIAGIVVYMFTSGTIGGLTTGGVAAQEKAAVQGVGSLSTAGVDVYAAYVAGGNPIEINGAIIRNANGDSTIGTCTDTLPVDGSLQTIAVTAILVSGNTYTVTLTSSRGGAFTSASFTIP
jgi:hypothetical protein